MRRLSALFIFLFPLLCGAQTGAHRIGQILVKGNNISANVAPYANIKVCQVDTNCNTLATIYTDPSLTVQATNPVIADGNGNYNYYIASGCVDEQISSAGQGSMRNNHVCPFNGQGGSGGNPAGNYQDTQFKGQTGSFAADPGFNQINPVQHFSRANMNGRLNSGIYNSIAAAQASAQCTYNCLIDQPTDATPETFPVPKTSSGIASDKNYSFFQSVQNPHEISMSHLGGSTSVSPTDCDTFRTHCLASLFNDIPPLPVTAVSRVGNTVTATFSASDLAITPNYNSVASVNITGCADNNPDNSINGVGTNVTVNVSTLTVTWTSSKSGSATCPSATISDNNFYDQKMGLTIPSLVDQVGFNYGNATYSNWRWLVGHGILISTVQNEMGIAQAVSATIDHYATGDTAGFYSYPWCDGGSPDKSAEGCSMETISGGQYPAFFHGNVGNIGANPVTGLTSLPIVYDSSIPTISPNGNNNNRNIIGGGSFLIDLSKPQLSTTVTGITTQVPGFNSQHKVVVLPINSGATPSTAWGYPNANMPNNPTDPHLPSTYDATYTVVGPVSGTGYHTGYAWLGGFYPERVIITEVGALQGDGTQHVKYDYINPHYGLEAALIQGGTNGFELFDNLKNLPNSTAVPFHVYGAIDATHLLVETIDYGTLAGYSPYIAPMTITAVTRTGTTVTASFDRSNINPASNYNLLANVDIQGCSDASINGTGTNARVNTNALTVTWTSMNSGNTICLSGATIGYSPGSVYGVNVYSGAAILSKGGAVAPTTLTLEPNDIVWNSNDTLIDPHHPWFAGNTLRTQATYPNPIGFARGLTSIMGGGGVSGNWEGLVNVNTNDCSMYVGCGGTLALPKSYFTSNEYDSHSPKGLYMDIGSRPIGGFPVFRIGPAEDDLGGTANVDPVQLISVEGVPTNSGRFTFYPSSTSFGGTGLIATGSGTETAPNGPVKGGLFSSLGSLGCSNQNCGGIQFSLNGTAQLGGMGICNSAQTTKDIFFSTQCTPAPGTTLINTAVMDTSTTSLNATAQLKQTAGQITLAHSIANDRPIGTVTGGSGTQRLYYYTIMFPTGEEGGQGVLATFSTAATLDGSNFVTFTCPAILQGNIPTGSVYRVNYLVDSGHRVIIGNCPVGGTLVDNGSATTVTTTPGADLSGFGEGAQWRAAFGGGFGFYSNLNQNVIDTYINRTGPKTISIGGTVGTAADGGLVTATGNFTSTLQRNGSNVCTADGSGGGACPTAAVSGVTVSGTSCTIKAITNGIITSATCP
jgi:hypothetical protein